MCRRPLDWWACLVAAAESRIIARWLSPIEGAPGKILSMNRELNRRQFVAASALVGAQLGQGRSIDPGSQEQPSGGRTRFAVNVEMWLRKLPFLDRIRAAAEMGFPAVEFWPWRNKDLDTVSKLCEELKIEVAQFTAWGFSPGLNDPKNHERFVQAIRDGCEAAHKIKCKKMTVVGGNDQKGMTQEQMHDHIIAGLKLAAPIAEKEDVMLILEPMNIRVDHKGHCLYGSPDAVRICREVNSTHVKINWDLYHMQISEGDLCGRLKDGLDQVGYLQLADHPGRHEPGTGEIYYNRVLKEAYDLGYRGYVGLECSPEGGDDKRAAARVRAADVW